MPNPPFIILSLFSLGDNYYSGDGSFWADLLTQFLTTLLAFGSALAIFYFEGKRDKKRKAKESKEKELSLITYVYLALESLIGGIQDQIKNFKEFQERTGMDSPNLSVKKITRIHFDWYERLNLNEFREAIFNNYFGTETEKSKSFIDLINVIVHLRVVNGIIEERHTSIMDKINSRLNDYNQAYVIFHNKLTSICSINNGNNLPPFENELDKIGDAYSKLPKNIRENPQKKFELLMEPIRIVCEKEKRSDLKEEYQQLYMHFINLEVYYKMLVTSFKEFQNSFEFCEIELERVNSVLSKILNNKKP